MRHSDTAIERAQERVSHELERARDAMTTMDRRARKLVAERPVTSLLVAVGVGYLVGRIVSRL